MILIYCDIVSSRLKYIFNLIFDNILCIEYSFTNDKIEFINSDLPKLNYSKQPFGDELFIYAHDLLFEKGISNKKVPTLNSGDQIVIFPVQSKSLISFDVISAIFYLVSRYEEYLDFEKDEFGRFLPENSIAFKCDFLDKPIVNIWTALLLNKIKERYPDIPSVSEKYRFISTIDVDNAYAFLHKGLIRTVGGFAKSLFFNFQEINLRLKVLLSLKKDVYDTYSYINQTHTKSNLNPLYFFLAGKYGKYDKNLPVTNTHFINLIQSLSNNYEIGFHTSFLSNKNINNLKNEHRALSEITNKKITKSRQHFLMLKFPETYRNLLSLNIEEDYSMGYPQVCGFRAGICTPFKFYDLLNETETNLMIFPFQVMDITLNKYMRLSPEEAVIYINKIVKEIKAVNGTFISIWHNESLSDTGIWKGWKYVFESIFH